MTKVTRVKPTPKPARKPSLATIMNSVAAEADTEGTAINVAETKRVIKTFIAQVQSDFPDPADRMNFLVKNFLAE